MSHPSPARALVVEDDPAWQQILGEILADCGLAVDVASSLPGAITAIQSQPHRLAVVDLSLSPADHNNTDGLRVLEAARQRDPHCLTLLLTGFATVELAVSALTQYGALTFLRKENFHRGQFRTLVNQALASAPVGAPSSRPAVSTVSGAARSLPPARPASAAGKALVVEDDAGWRGILGELLADAGFAVRTCSSFGDALGALRREKYALAVIDLSLNGRTWEPENAPDQMEGYPLLESTRANGIPTIVVSGLASPAEIERTYTEQGIFAYLEKQTFERAAFLRLVEELRRQRSAETEFAALTEREREVLDLLAQGLTNKEIGEKLFITANTVKRHLKAVFEKLDVHTRAAAAARALAEQN